MIKEETGAQLKAPDIAKYSGISTVKLERIMMDTGIGTKREDKPENPADTLHLGTVSFRGLLFGKG